MLKLELPTENLSVNRRNFPSAQSQGCSSSFWRHGKQRVQNKQTSRQNVRYSFEMDFAAKLAEFMNEFRGTGKPVS